MPDPQIGGKLKSLFFKKPPLKKRFLFAGLLIGGLLAFAAFVVEADMTISGWFYEKERGFYLADQPFFLFLQWLAHFGPRMLASGFGLAALYGGLARQKVIGLDAKNWLFLFLALLIGPGLIVNAGFKDHWGRARPREISAFGGHEVFSPALEPQTVRHKNGSFVSGDAAFGFFLPAFAYVVPLERKRKLSCRIFWGCMLAGCAFGMTRIVMGAHFFSDVLFAAFFVLLATAILHAAMFGRKTTAIYWRDWFFDRKNLP